MKAVLAAAMLMVAPMAASAGSPIPSYAAEQVVELSVVSADLGAERGICIGTAVECGLVPPQAQDESQDQEEAQDQEQAALDTPEVMVNFELDSDELSEVDKAKLLEFVEALRDPRFAEADFAIEGHTDAIGPEDYNQHLSQRRADAVIRFLRQQGVDTSRFVARGYGQTRPRSEDPFDPVNRRAETRLIPQ